MESFAILGANYRCTPNTAPSPPPLPKINKKRREKPNKKIKSGCLLSHDREIAVERREVFDDTLYTTRNYMEIIELD